MADTIPQAIDPVDNELRHLYRLPGNLPDIEVVPGATALVIIDMQYLDAHRDGEFGRRAREHGIEDKVEWFFERLDQTTLPAIIELLSVARDTGLDVVYTRIASLTGDGRDLGWRYQYWGMTAGLDEKDSQILPELAPLPNEIVITKTTTSAFIGSHIDTVLRHLGARTLIVCGVMTSGCVESTVRDAADYGYRVLLAEDACAALTRQAHDNSINAMDPVFARAKSTAEIIAQIESATGITASASEQVRAR